MYYSKKHKNNKYKKIRQQKSRKYKKTKRIIKQLAGSNSFNYENLEPYKKKINKNKYGGSNILSGKKSISEFKHLLRPYIGKKEYVLLCLPGPSILNLKDKKKFSKKFIDKCTIIAIKNSINYIKELDLPVDFLLTNHQGGYNKINFNHLKGVNKPINICHTYGNPKYSQWDFIINFKGKEKYDSFDCVDNNLDDCLNFKEENNELNVPNQHGSTTILELGIPVSLLLKPKKIIIIGWDLDIKQMGYYNRTTIPNVLLDDQKWINKIIKNTSNLKNYIKHHYNIDIYKVSPIQKINFPIFNSYL